MARWLAFLAVALSLSASAGDSPLDIIVSVPERHPLIGFVQGDLGEAYRRIGLHMVLKPLPSARSVEAANSGQTDAEAGRVRETGQLYANLREVPIPLLEMEILLVTTGVPFPATGWDGLKGRHICVGLGDKLAERRTAGATQEVAHGLESMVHMLRSGRCEAAVITQFTWLEIDRLHLGPLCPGPADIEKVPLYHYVNAVHADLIPRLTDALRAMREDGTSERTFAPVRDEIEQAKSRSASCAGVTDADRR